MKTGDVAKAAPDLTGLNEWVEGTIFDIEANRGQIFFGPEQYMTGDEFEKCVIEDLRVLYEQHGLL